MTGNRNSIFLEDGVVVSQQAFAGGQYVLRVRAPACAQKATPGTFAHITVADSIPMRRPLSIMRADPEAGWIEFLYKTAGMGLSALAARKPGETVSVLGPIGKGFEPDANRPIVLAIGGGVGIPPMLFLAETLREQPRFRPFVIMGSELPFPFDYRETRARIPGIPESACGVVPLLDDWGIPSRLASGSGLKGAYSGLITELATAYLQALPEADRALVQIAACGPTPMLKATADVAAAHDVPCQVALEEYMACGVGGCAGCTVLIQTQTGPAMQRVCVDGPVFDAATVVNFA